MSDGVWQIPDNEPPSPPVESLQVLDLIGIGLSTGGMIAESISIGLKSLANDFYAAARLRRIRQEERRQQREVGRYLEHLVEGSPHA